MEKGMLICISVLALILLFLYIRKTSKERYYRNPVEQNQLDYDSTIAGKYYFDNERDRKVGERTFNGESLLPPEVQRINADDQIEFQNVMMNNTKILLPNRVEDLNGDVWKPLPVSIRPEWKDKEGAIRCVGDSGFCQMVTPATGSADVDSAWNLIRNREIDMKEILELAKTQKNIQYLHYLNNDIPLDTAPPNPSYA